MGCYFLPKNSILWGASCHTPEKIPAYPRFQGYESDTPEKTMPARTVFERAPGEGAPLATTANENTVDQGPAWPDADSRARSGARGQRMWALRR